MPRADSLPIRRFARERDWAAWLSRNHDRSPGLWLQIAKKGADIPSVSYPAALDVALCYGWIDAQKRSHSDKFWLQKFGPRARRSLWSRNNRERALALSAAGRMHPPGMAEIERAKADGRWERAYDSPKTAEVPDDLRVALDAQPAAAEFFAGLDSINRYAILHRIQGAKKPETRARRIEQFVAMCSRGETVHPRRTAR